MVLENMCKRLHLLSCSSIDTPCSAEAWHSVPPARYRYVHFSVSRGNGRPIQPLRRHSISSTARTAGRDMQDRRANRHQAGRRQHLETHTKYLLQETHSLVTRSNRPTRHPRLRRGYAGPPYGLLRSANGHWLGMQERCMSYWRIHLQHRK